MTEVVGSCGSTQIGTDITGIDNDVSIAEHVALFRTAEHAAADGTAVDGDVGAL